MTDISMQLQSNLEHIRQRIARACQNAGREINEVRLLPVSKTVDVATLRVATQLGLTELGENKVQEALHKSEEMADITAMRWVLIGHLQTNKAKYAARFATEFQALDSLRVAEALDNQLQKLGRSLDVLVQVNTSHEDSKFGLAPNEVSNFIKQLPVFHSLRVRGLMTLATHSDDENEVRRCFIELRTLRDQLRQNAPDGVVLNELSMGMSGDLELAIAEGATTVRVGTAIFGKRHTPNTLS